MTPTLYHRSDLVSLLPERPIGAELGVAAGSFSDLLLHSHSALILYSIDSWNDPSRKHDDREFLAVKKRLSVYGKRSHIVRETFEDAAMWFPPYFFDFIYVDGYAHTGQEGGRTLEQWYYFLKQGGVFAGHDYSDEWPLTKRSVDALAWRKRRTVQVIGGAMESSDVMEREPSWWWIK